jgi:hypothetical protein
MDACTGWELKFKSHQADLSVDLICGIEARLKLPLGSRRRQGIVKPMATNDLSST